MNQSYKLCASLDMMHKNSQQQRTPDLLKKNSGHSRNFISAKLRNLYISLSKFTVSMKPQMECIHKD